MMGKRAEKLKLAQIFFIEYLKLMAHYKLLHKDQHQQLKQFMEEQERLERGEEGGQPPSAAPFNPFQSREAAIARHKQLKQI
mmetsp:Transcript_19255/g.13923  ORF Transcript_19255/g.13923 Transcript_19255/m.13923 type:complete len:82 (+) Transcript_19255:261-506(+)